MRYFLTEEDTVISEEELKAEYKTIKDDGEHDGITFGQYLRNCLESSLTPIED